MLIFLLFTITVSLSCASWFQSYNATARDNSFTRTKCPCANPNWCNPVVNVNKTEVFAFSVRNSEDNWMKYAWPKVTTIVQFGYINSSLVCLAHSHNTRVVALGGISVETMVDLKERRAWIQKQLTIVQDNFFDGLNFDFEGVIEEEQSDIRDAYTQTVKETVEAFKAVSPHYQISVDVAWKPNVDSRYYDYKGLGQVADLLFVMAYDQQSQIFGECVALPNSGLQQTTAGLTEYLSNPEFKVAPDKLVLGVPWYGYGYACIDIIGDKCLIHEIPFRGVPCSDAAGKQFGLSFISTLLMTLPNAAKWNSSSSTPFVSYEEAPGIGYQMQFDDARSCGLKFSLARKLGLRGVGMWNIDSLDFTNTEEAEAMRHDMFAALP